VPRHRGPKHPQYFSNFLFYREGKLSLLHTIVNKAPGYHENTVDLSPMSLLLNNPMHLANERMEEINSQRLSQKIDLKSLCL
jgi:hypothetical protein